ncbi:MAG: hypothetical protein H0W29_04920 [Gemmatimonadales bacterium]|nr:hypothetical protein [Gemmatimonadales bacterium]
MMPHRALLALAALLAAPAGGIAQQPPAATDTAGIHTTLRAFYFNLAHDDWEAIAGKSLGRAIAEPLSAAPPRGPA